MSIFDLFMLLGGIALFLFGMDMMSKGLERAAGNRMRSILQALTKNRFIATLVGVVITAIIQSSNAVTATVVSFVNAGLMELTQSVGVIFGANIGTSITGQLMAFSFDKIAPLIIAISVIFYLFVKNDMAKKVAYIVLGFGILFLGMSMMKEGMSTLAESPQVIGAIQSANNPFLLLLIGFVVTAIIQSNSAMTGILIGMASSGLIAVDMCFYVLLGSNIGCCVSAVLASVNGNRNSKRAALIHVLFNIIGTAIIFIILAFLKPQVSALIALLSPGTGTAQIAREVAMANTVFRVFNVLIMFPFANGLVKLTKIIIPVKDHSGEIDDLSKPKYISDHNAITGSTALYETGKEIDRVGQMAISNLKLAYSMLRNRSKKELEQVKKMENNIDEMTSVISKFMIKVTQMELSPSDELRVSGFFHTNIDIERIGDYAVNLAEFAQKEIDEKIVFSDEAWNELDKIFNKVLENVIESLRIFKESDLSAIATFSVIEDQIDDMEDEYQRNHINRMTRGVCSAKSEIFSEILSNLERVGDHATNIAFSAVPEGKFLNLETGELIDKK